MAAMKMTRCTAAILLVLSLGALAAGRLTADNGADTILLPSQAAGLADDLAAEEAKPPQCCNLALCTRSQPPTCRCVDKVEKCAKTCKDCEKDTASSLYVCQDQYKGYPKPMCAKSVNDGPGVAGLPEATAAEATVDNGEEKPRPWTCCDMALCNRAFPPSCRCTDQVEECAKTCERCTQVEGSSRYMCLDWYKGSRGPACTPAAPTTFTPRGN